MSVVLVRFGKKRYKFGMAIAKSSLEKYLTKIVVEMQRDHGNIL